MSKKTVADNGVTAAVAAYLENGVTLQGAQEPLAAVALLLAESMEAAPPYARASLARQLHSILSELEQKSDWELERGERRAERMRQATWASNGETT
jgi:hypothetical protein